MSYGIFHGEGFRSKNYPWTYENREDAEAAIGYGVLTPSLKQIHKSRYVVRELELEGAVVPGVEIEGEWEPMVSMPISEHSELVSDLHEAQYKLAAIKRIIDAMMQDPDGADFYRHIGASTVFKIEKIVTGKEHVYSPGALLLDGICDALRRQGDGLEYYEVDLDMLGKMGRLNPELPKLINGYLEEVSSNG